MSRELKIPVLLLILGLLFCPQSSWGECEGITRSQYISYANILIKGKVRDRSRKKSKAYANPLTVFKIEVKKVFKGKVKPKVLDVEFENVKLTPPIRKFKENQTYIFAIDKIEGRLAKIDYSGCAPILGDADLR